MAINGVLSGGFFYALFGGRDRISLWGMGNFVFDLLPQGFMVAMMGSLVPGLLARKAWRTDRPTIAAPARVLSWSLQSAITAAAIGTALAGAALWLAGIDTLPFSPGLIVKMTYGVGDLPCRRCSTVSGRHRPCQRKSIHDPHHRSVDIARQRCRHRPAVHAA